MLNEGRRISLHRNFSLGADHQLDFLNAKAKVAKLAHVRVKNAFLVGAQSKQLRGCCPAEQRLASSKHLNR